MAKDKSKWESRSPAQRRRALHQEVLDLFSRNSGDYMPSTHEVECVNDGLEHLLKEFIPDA